MISAKLRIYFQVDIEIWDWDFGGKKGSDARDNSIPKCSSEVKELRPPWQKCEWAS